MRGKEEFDMNLTLKHPLRAQFVFLKRKTLVLKEIFRNWGIRMRNPAFTTETPATNSLARRLF